MTEDQQNSQQQQQQQQASSSSSSKEQRKTSIHDIRNQDFVSRLLAATPPYLYSAPVGPNNFFFSDMLRSLVQAKNNENARNIQLQQAALASRRPRKRSWSNHQQQQQHRPYELLKERRELDEKIIEKPLELTTTCKQQLYPIASKYSKNILDASKENSHLKISTGNHLQQQSGINLNENKLNEFHHDLRNDSTPQSHIVIPSVPDSPSSSTLTSSASDQQVAIPPPPPVWYPPIYSPYGIDPLHFFIDLRVSGHIYDRKKDNSSPLNNKIDNSSTGNSNENETIGKHRHGSAFTVPAPRNESKTTSAINLSTSSSSNNTNNNNNSLLDNLEKYNKYYNIGEIKENLPNSGKTTNYVLQNLPRLYTQQTNSRDSDDNKSDKDDDDDIDNQERNNRGESGLIDVELNPEDDDIIHQID